SNLYQRRFEICEGYNRILIACEEIAAHVDLRGRFLVQIEPVGDSAGREVIFGLVDFLRFEDGFGATVPSLTPKASREPKELVNEKRTAKCVVWDLDIQFGMVPLPRMDQRLWSRILWQFRPSLNWTVAASCSQSPPRTILK